jgi:hypothetical protein
MIPKFSPEFRNLYFNKVPANSMEGNPSTKLEIPF